MLTRAERIMLRTMLKEHGLEPTPALPNWNDAHNAKVAERLRKCLQSITTPVRIRTLALEDLKSDGNQEEFADTKDI